MQIRCPHCQNAIELVDDSDFQSIDCPSCGSQFGLVDVGQTEIDTLSKSRGTTATIGHFELIEEVGRGAFGTVWRARDSELDREVAIKIPREHRVSADDREQFLREARAAAQLSHPNIVTVYEVGRDGEQLYIVSDFVKGVTLAEKLTAQRLAPRGAVALCVKIAEALEHAHEKGVIHRDLKPSNVMLTVDNEPLVMDFGLAKRDAGEITITVEGKVLGTPAYMPPEQASGEGHHVDRRADVYSLGVILYELLSRELPFRGATRMLLHQVIHDEAPSPRKLNNAIPRDLETITLKCLQKDPGRRYQTTQALADDLTHWLEGKPITARPVTWMERSWRWCKRKPAVAGLSASIILLLVSGILVSSKLAFWALDERDRADQSARISRQDRDVAVAATKKAESAQKSSDKSMEQAKLAQKASDESMEEAEAALAAQLKAEAERRVVQANSLIQATPEAAAIILSNLQSDSEGVQAALQNLLEDESLPALKKTRVRLGLLANDPGQLKPIVDFLLSDEGQQLDPEELLLIRNVLEPYGGPLAARFIPLLEQPEGSLRAACVLASFAGPEVGIWQTSHQLTTNADVIQTSPSATTQADVIAALLVNVMPSELAPYRQLLRPVQQHLVGPLSVIYRDDDQGEQVRFFATDTLADYLSDDPEALFDLLADADQKQFPVIYNKLAVHQKQAIELGNAQVAKPGAAGAREEDKEALAIRKANAAAMLLRLDAPDEVWPLLRHSPDPRVRSYIIHWLSPRDVDPVVIADRFKVELDVTIRRALLLCLGEFSEFDLKHVVVVPNGRWNLFMSEEEVQERSGLIRTVLSIYRNDPDPGLHAAAEWLLKSASADWAQAEQVASIDKELQQTEQQLRAAEGKLRQWYVNGQGQTFVILDAKSFQMGSPKAEVGHSTNEVLHTRRIDRRFAISTREVTKAQWRAFSDKTGVWSADQEQLAKYLPSEDSAMIAMNWYEAANYCNWLSEQEGIPEDQWCYEPNEEGRYAEGMKAKEGFLELGGYRLPTEAEWEYACRAGAETSRYYGQTESLLEHYAWYQSNSKERSWPVARLKPNDLGLFDMQGNVWEWCYDAYGSYRGDEADEAVDQPSSEQVLDADDRVLRGGSFRSPTSIVRSANRNGNPPDLRSSLTGFRAARTYNVSP